MKINFLFFAFIFITSLSCHKTSITPLPEPNPCNFGLCDTSIIQIVWQNPISSDTSEKFSIAPVYFNGSVLFSRSTLEEAIDTVKQYESSTGTLKWQWADYLPRRKPSIVFGIPIKFIDNDKYVFTTDSDIYCVNAQNGQSIWKYQLASGSANARIGYIGKCIYQVIDYGFHSTDSSRLLRLNIDAPTVDPVYTQLKVNDFEPRIHPPTVSWQNGDGDSVLFFQIRYWNFPASKGRIDWVAYNLKKKAEEFKLVDIDKGQIGTTVGAVVSDSLVFFCGSASAYAVNRFSGALMWQKDFNNQVETILSTTPFVVENKVFIKTDNKTLYALDTKTGNEVWMDKDAGSSCSNMIYDRGLLYYVCNGNAKIYAVEAATGNKIWAEPSPNHYPNKFNGNRRFGFSNSNIGNAGGLAIDVEHNVLFASDDYFNMCLKLPKK